MVVQSMVKFVNSILRFKVPELFRATTTTPLAKNMERGKLIPLKSVYNTMSIHNMQPLIPESSSINIDNDKILKPIDNECKDNPIVSSASALPIIIIKKSNADNTNYNVGEEVDFSEECYENDNDDHDLAKDDEEYFYKKNLTQNIKANQAQTIYEGIGIKMYVPGNLMTLGTKRHNLHEFPPDTPNDQRIVFKQKLIV